MKLKYFDELKKSGLIVGIYLPKINPKKMSFMQLKNYHTFCTKETELFMPLKEMYKKYSEYDVVSCEYRKGTLNFVLSKDVVLPDNDNKISMVKLVNNFDTCDLIGLTNQIRFIIKGNHPKLTEQELVSRQYSMIPKKDFMLENGKRYIFYIGTLQVINYCV